MAITPFTRQTMMTNDDTYQTSPADGTSLSSTDPSRNNAQVHTSRSFSTFFVARDGMVHPDVTVPALDDRDLTEGMRSDTECPHPGPDAYVNWKTGERYRRGCGKIRCNPCARALATRTALAIERAAPTHMVTLTLTGDDWQKTRATMGEFNRRQRGRSKRPWAMAYHVHVNLSFDGERHIHAYVRGDVDEDLIATNAAKAGFGSWIDVQEIRGRAYGYGLHPVFDTKDMDPIEARDHLHEYLAANGWQLVHATRGANQFWRDLNGNPTTLKDARKATTGEDWSVERWRAA